MPNTDKPIGTTDETLLTRWGNKSEAAKN